MTRRGESADIRGIVAEIRSLLAQYGMGALTDRDRTAAYLRRRFPRQAEDVDACLEVLYLPRFLECLIWLENDPKTEERAAQCWAYYDGLLTGGGNSAARRANRLFLLG